MFTWLVCYGCYCAFCFGLVFGWGYVVFVAVAGRLLTVRFGSVWGLLVSAL